MGRREEMLGIAEKLPKSTLKMPKALESKALESRALASKAVAGKALPKALPEATASPAVRRRIVALEGRSLRKRH
jgi:phosphoribosyl-ATP pyrophosphohydrolase